jgi:hypothetical protein
MNVPRALRLRGNPAYAYSWTRISLICDRQPSVQAGGEGAAQPVLISGGGETGDRRQRLLASGEAAGHCLFAWS